MDASRVVLGRADRAVSLERVVAAKCEAVDVATDRAAEAGRGERLAGRAGWSRARAGAKRPGVHDYAVVRLKSRDPSLCTNIVASPGCASWPNLAHCLDSRRDMRGRSVGVLLFL